nr:FAD-dependent oxidoreductase [uncultured Acetatifactor sp.]
MTGFFPALKEIRPILYRSRPCTPGSHLAHSSYRVMPICVNLGQAACTAAAIAVQNGQQVRDIPVVRLQQIFLDASASGSDAKRRIARQAPGRARSSQRERTPPWICLW